MKVYVIRDGYFTTSAQGPSSKIVSYDNFSSRYLSAFEEVELVGRLFDKVENGSKPVTGINVSFTPIRGYKGPAGFLKNILSIISLIFKSTHKGSGYILRLPATVPILFGFILLLKKIPYAVEVVGDPYDAYSPEVLNNRFSKLFQFIFTFSTKVIVKNAKAAAYVTEYSLQKNYPANDKVPSYSYTSLDLPDEGFVSQARTSDEFSNKTIVLSHIGMMEQNYKGHDTLIDTVSMLRAQGYDVKVKFVGSGSLETKFKKLVMEKGLNEYIEFCGLVSAGTNVREILDSSDIFVLPSRQEGLPRAMIEAMARGLPCVGSTVGGIPELLDNEYLIEPGDSFRLFEILKSLINSPNLLAKCSNDNLRKSQKYNLSIVRASRESFYNIVRKASIK